MYIVKINNGGVETEIHGFEENLASGSVVKGVNSIDTLSFSMFPSNAGFDMLREFQTLVTVYNTFRNRYEFHGRVLYSNPSMSESGLIEKDITCESYFGFFCDSWQTYVVERNWTVRELFSHIVETHNAQVEPYKRFTIGRLEVADPNDNLYLGIQRKNTWDTLKEKLLDKLGGEFCLRVEDGVNYIDYLVEIGEVKSTEIALSRNMKSIAKEKDPSAYVTRLIPLGAKIKDAEGKDTEERIGIESVNGGVGYLDDLQAIAEYGIHVGSMEWDDVTEPANLKSKAQRWLVENNKVKIKYSINALDLSAIGLDIDDFEVGNWHPIKNALLGIDDVARINKKAIDILKPTSSTIEIGENFKTLSDLQVEQAEKTNQVLLGIMSTYVPSKRFDAEKTILNNAVAENAQLVAEMRELIYPVGSVYISTNSTNPSAIFGGSWVQIEDRFLLAAGSTYAAGSYGGEATHTLTVNEIPSHAHDLSDSEATSYRWSNADGSWANFRCGDSTVVGNGISTKYTGGSQAHNNMPPYLAVYMWRRVS